MRCRPIVIASLLLVLLCRPLCAQYDANGYPKSDDDDSGDLALLVLGGIAAAVAGTAPVWVPRWLLEEESEPGFFFEYPYYEQRWQYLDLGQHPAEGATVWGATITGDYSTDGDIDRAATRITFDSTSRFGFESEFNHLWGTLEDRPWDEMQTGDAHVLWRFAQHPCVQFRAGLGFRWLTDELDTNYGFSGHYGVEIQPVRPLAISLQVEGGTLRHDPFLHGRMTLGLLWKRTELFAGFDYLQIDELESAGPVAGLRLWL